MVWTCDLPLSRPVLKVPTWSRKYPFPPPMEGICHMPPLPPSPPSYPFGFFRKAPVPIHTLLPNWLKKTVHTPTPEGMCPMLPLPYHFEFSRIAPVPKHTPSCCPESYWQHQSSNACHTIYRVSWIWLSREKTFVHVGKICHTRIFFVCSELLGL